MQLLAITMDRGHENVKLQGVCQHALGTVGNVELCGGSRHQPSASECFGFPLWAASLFLMRFFYRDRISTASRRHRRRDSPAQLRSRILFIPLRGCNVFHGVPYSTDTIAVTKSQSVQSGGISAAWLNRSNACLMPGNYHFHPLTNN